MKKKIKYTDEPLGDLSVVRDFLPPPEELAFKEESVKVTMTLSKSSVAFFKKAAQKYHTPYQKMIRKLIDAYATRHHLTIALSPRALKKLSPRFTELPFGESTHTGLP